MARKIILRFFGIAFLVGAVYLAVSAVSIYAQQQSEVDWRISMATVTDVTRRWENRGVSGHSSLVYDITYQYSVNNDSYTGEIIGSLLGKEEGDRFDIKYDPESPERSTDILEPQPDALVFNFLGAFLFAAVGLWASGLFSFLSRLRHRADSGATE